MIMSKYLVKFKSNDEEKVIIVEASDKSGAIKETWRLLGNTIVITSIEG